MSQQLTNTDDFTDFRAIVESGVIPGKPMVSGTRWNITPADVVKVLDAYAGTSKSLLKVCEDMNIRYAEFDEATVLIPALRTARIFADRRHAAWLIAETVTLADDDSGDINPITGAGNAVAVARSALRIRTRQWVAERIDRAAWAAQTKVDVTATIQQSTAKIPDPDQLDAMDITEACQVFTSS